MLGAGLMLAPQILSAKGKTDAGLQLYTLREQLPKDVKGVIAKVAEAGYKQVEVFGYSKDNGYWGLKPAEFRALLDQHGLTSPSGHYGMDQFLTDGTTTDLDDVIASSKILGHKYVTLPSAGGKFRNTAADVKALVGRMNEAAARIQKAGMRMGYHNHNFEFTPIDGVPLYTSLLEGTDPKLIDFEMDLFWVVRAGQDPVKLFESHPGRFTMVHVKDMDKQNPKINTEVGAGSIDFKQIFAKAKVAGIKYYIVEQENFSIDPYVSIQQSCKYLKDVLLA